MWDDVYDYAFAELGLTYDEFYAMDWTEYDYRVESYRIKHARAWEHTRHLETFVVNMFSDKDKQMKPYELYPLFTDSEVADVEKSLDVNKELWKRLAANNFYRSPKNNDAMD